jgi:hypothetical protein
MSDNPNRILLDVTGSQVGTQANPFFIAGFPTSSCPAPIIQNNINLSTVNYLTETSASYVLSEATASLPNGRTHELLRELVHLSAMDGPRGSLFPSGMVNDEGPWPFPTASIWWTDASRTTRYMDQYVVRSANRLILTSTWRVFQADGITVADSSTEVITYSGIFPISRTRT